MFCGLSVNTVCPGSETFWNYQIFFGKSGETVAFAYIPKASLSFAQLFSSKKIPKSFLSRKLGWNREAVLHSHMTSSPLIYFLWCYITYRVHQTPDIDTLRAWITQSIKDVTPDMLTERECKPHMLHNTNRHTSKSSKKAFVLHWIRSKSYYFNFTGVDDIRFFYQKK
jgi:hypothetical protein